MISWVLWLIIGTGTPSVQTTSQAAVYYQTKDLCDAAAKQLVSELKKNIQGTFIVVCTPRGIGTP